MTQIANTLSKQEGYCQVTNSSEESSLARRKALNMGMNTFIFLSPVGILMASYGQMFLKVSYLEKNQSKLSECFL